MTLTIKKTRRQDWIDRFKALHGPLRELEDRKIGTANVLSIDLVPKWAGSFTPFRFRNFRPAYFFFDCQYGKVSAASSDRATSAAELWLLYASVRIARALASNLNALTFSRNLSVSMACNLGLSWYIEPIRSIETISKLKSFIILSTSAAERTIVLLFFFTVYL